MEFETNKGRVMSFHPHLATKQRDQEVTMRAQPGHEIIMLRIKWELCYCLLMLVRHGCLEGIVEQEVSQDEKLEWGKEWLVGDLMILVILLLSR